MFDDKCIILPISRMFASVSTPSKAQGTITGENIIVSLLSRSASNCFSCQKKFCLASQWSWSWSQSFQLIAISGGILNPESWSFQLPSQGGPGSSLLRFWTWILLRWVQPGLQGWETHCQQGKVLSQFALEVTFQGKVVLLVQMNIYGWWYTDNIQMKIICGCRAHGWETHCQQGKVSQVHQ